MKRSIYAVGQEKQGWMDGWRKRYVILPFIGNHCFPLSANESLNDSWEIGLFIDYKAKNGEIGHFQQNQYKPIKMAEGVVSAPFLPFNDQGHKV